MARQVKRTTFKPVRMWAAFGIGTTQVCESGGIKARKRDVIAQMDGFYMHWRLHWEVVPVSVQRVK